MKRTVTPNDPPEIYDAARRISNARFDYRPSVIYYCETREDVQYALSQAKSPRRLPVRVRSGGHHHEGMCSGDEVVIIDLSSINEIDVAGDIAWIGAGAKLIDVYARMKEKGFLLPGGGCDDVRVGGLVQGGGWGPYSRRLGLTCDNLIGFEMVTADGAKVDVNEGDKRYTDLLWAVRGGGGGNFGIITRFKFRLAPRPRVITEFSLSWSDKSVAEAVIEKWRGSFPNADPNVTTFCRVSAPGSGDPPAFVYGLYLDEQPPDAATKIKTLLSDSLFDKATPDFHVYPREGAHGLTHPGFQPGPPRATALGARSEASPGDLKTTCDGGSYFHKISSCFPRQRFGTDAVKEIVKYVFSSVPDSNARRYLSLHCLGGAIKSSDAAAKTSFAWRDKDFMLQYQAWWTTDTPAARERYLMWILYFRWSLSYYTEGSFINFPDRDLVAHPETPRGRKELLEYYYAGNLDRLIGIKRAWDKNNVLDFAMGIPVQ